MKLPRFAPGQMNVAVLLGDQARASLGVSEFLVSRARLFAGRSGGLRAVVDDEGDFLTGFSTHGMDPFEPRPGDSPMRPPDRPDRVRSRLIDRCVACHLLPGVFSFNTFAQNFPAAGGPHTYLSIMPVSEVLASGVAWKKTREDWALLQRLLRAANTRQ